MLIFALGHSAQCLNKSRKAKHGTWVKSLQGIVDSSVCEIYSVRFHDVDEDVYCYFVVCTMCETEHFNLFQLPYLSILTHVLATYYTP